LKYFKIVLTTLFTTYSNANIFNMTPIISYLLSDTMSPTLTINYTEDSSVNILNPDRGFYDADYALNLDRDYNMFEGAMDAGYMMVYAPINLEEYNTTAILPSTLIDTISKNLNDANNTGVKLILRVKYRSGLNGYDPSKDIILDHLNQLKPLLKIYKNIISVIQAGTIGAWGEWHSFTGDYEESNIDYINNRRDIIAALVGIFPDKYIQIRTPMHKELLYGSSVEYADESKDGEITSNIAFTNDIKAKVGHHNDCFLASETDMGTYPSDNIDFWKAYVINDTKYSPVGGETCNDEEVFTTCLNAISELKKFQYSYINHTYHPNVIQRWQDEGCYEEISENIGYRLVAKKLDMQQSTNVLNLSLSIENKGYAAPYIKSNVNLILKNNTNEYTFEQDIDIRTFYSQEVKIIDDRLSLNNIENGEYCLYIQIGESYSAIRLSNSLLWEESSKTNKLACNIIVK